MKNLFAALFLASSLAAHAAIPPDVLDHLASSDLAKRFEAETKLRKLAFEAGNPKADPAIVTALENDLLTLASNTSAPEASRLSALEQLPCLASASSVPGLAALLSDPTPIIREGARSALQNNPAPAASTPLLEALEKSDQTVWTLGLMDSLATRADAAAIPAFAARLKSPTPAIAALAAESLGSLGGAESLKALNSFLPTCPPALLPAAQSALIRCAIPQAGSDQTLAALWPQASGASIRCQIFSALASQGDASKALPFLNEILAKQDTPGTPEILRLAILSGHASLQAPIFAALPNLSVDSRLAVHAALAEKSDTTQEADLLALAAALDGTKQATAILLLGSCGTENSLDFLVAEAEKKSPVTLPSAATALNRLKAPGLDQRLLEQVKSNPTPESISLLAYRNPEGTEAILIKLAAPEEPADLRARALSVLETMGAFDSAAQLLAWIGAAPQGADSKPYIAAFRRIAPRLSAEAVLWETAFLPAFSTASPENRNALFHTIPALRCPKSGATLVEWVRNDPNIRPTAVDELASWSNFASGDSILAAASTPGLDEPSRDKLYKAAIKLFNPKEFTPKHLIKDYAKKVLAAAPEGPIRDSVQQAITSAKLSD